MAHSLYAKTIAEAFPDHAHCADEIEYRIRDSHRTLNHMTRDALLVEAERIISRAQGVV